LLYKFLYASPCSRLLVGVPCVSTPRGGHGCVPCEVLVLRCVLATPGARAMIMASGVGAARAVGVEVPQLWVIIALVAMLFVASQGVTGNLFYVVFS